MKPQFPVLLLAGGALCLAPFALAAPALPAQTIALPAAKTAEAPALYGAWRSAQIGGGGYVQNVISTRAPGVFYAYVDVGGVYRSDDGGKRWRMIHGGLPASSLAYYMRDLSVNPTNENDVVIATGDQWTSGGGFFRTLDGGKTWKKTGEAQFYGNENGRWMGAALARDASNPKRIWGASQGGGVWQSLDGGATWKLLGLEGVWCVDVDVDRSNSNRLLVSAQSNKVWRGQTQVEIAGGFYLSQDGGATWKKLLDDGPTEIVQDASDAKIFYGIFESRLVRRSRDGGLTWQDFSDGLPISDKDQREEYNSTASFNALASGPDFLVVGANKGVFYRLDKGQTKWRKIEREGATENYEGRPWFARMEPGKWQHFGAALASITIDPRNPKRWFFTDWFAIYRSEDAGKHWDLSMDGVEVTVLHTLLPDPSDAGAVHLGMADNGYFLSLDGGASFDKPNSFSNCKSLAIAPVLPARVYGTGDRGNGQWRASQLWVSTDRGQSWTRSPMLGLPDMDAHSCNSVAVAPDDPFTVYLGVSKEIGAGGGVYKSSDGGKSWAIFSAGLPDGQAIFAHNIFGIGQEIAAQTNGQLAAISRDGRAVYAFDGQTWKQTKKFENAPMSVAAGAPGTFFVAVRNEGVFRSLDGGQSWENVWKGDAAHVATDPARPTRLAVGVSDGVIWSDDNGNSWRRADPNLPFRAAPVVAISDERLYAGTFGSGAFWMPLSARGQKVLAARPLAQTLASAQMKPLELVKNGDMNAGAETPAGWGLWTGGGAPKLSRDTTTFQASGASLRLDGGEGAYGAASQGLALTKKPFVVSGYLKTTPGIEESNVAIRVVDDKGKQIEWIPLFSGPVADWTRWEKTVTLPQNAAGANLTTTIKGAGSLWLDEIQTAGAPEIWKEDATPAPATVAPAQTALEKPSFALPNGSMNQGEGAPAGWNQSWTASGKLVLTRDTADFKVGPAALQLATEGKSQGAASLPLGGAKGSFTLSGYAKSSGALDEALVAVQSFGADGKQVGWTTLFDAKGIKDWTKWTQKVELPAEATRAQIIVTLNGEGKIGLDELEVE